MPLLLDTPHTYSPGHGQPEAFHPYVMIVEFTVSPIKRSLVLVMQYGDLVNGEWVSNEPTTAIRIMDKPAIESSGVDPDTGAYVVDIVTPADPAFTALKDAFLIAAAHEGMSVYDLLGGYLYNYLIASGAYSGTIE